MHCVTMKTTGEFQQHVYPSPAFHRHNWQMCFMFTDNFCTPPQYLLTICKATTPFLHLLYRHHIPGCHNLRMFMGSVFCVHMNWQQHAHLASSTWTVASPFSNWCCAGSAFPACVKTPIAYWCDHKPALWWHEACYHHLFHRNRTGKLTSALLLQFGR